MTKKEGFDQVFDHVGSFGCFQVLLLICITFQALVSWNHLSYVFLGAVPPHWCNVPELDGSGWTSEQIKNISIPQAWSGSQHSWESCNYYDLDYTQILASSNHSFESAYSSSLSYRNSSTDLRKCSKWNWDLSIYESTVATEFDLVCDRRILVGTIQGTYMFGVLIGSLLLGSLSDQLLGRRKSVLISIVLSILGGFASAFSTSYQAFVFFRFIVAAGVAGSYQNCYVLMLEYTSSSSRALFGLVGQLSFAFGYMLIAILGYFFRNWADLQLACSGINLILLSYFWILPESSRWLAHKGRDEEAYNLIKLVARLNRKPIPDREIIYQIFRGSRDSSTIIDGNLTSSSKQLDEQSRSKRCFEVFKITWLNYWKLLQTPELRKRTLLIWSLFVIVDLVYYGVVFDSATLTSDPYVLVFMAGLMEVPAYTLVVPCLSNLGRRPTVVGTFFLTAICSLAVAYLPIEYEIFRIVLSMSGKLFITTCFAVLYLLGAELFPTATRTTGLASAIIMGRLGSILAPFIVDMMKTVYLDLPNIIFGMVSIAAGIMAILLPETRDCEMPDDINFLEKTAYIKRKESIASANLRRGSKISEQINVLSSSFSKGLIGINGNCDPS